MLATNGTAAVAAATPLATVVAVRRKRRFPSSSSWSDMNSPVLRKKKAAFYTTKQPEVKQTMKIVLLIRGLRSPNASPLGPASGTFPPLSDRIRNVDELVRDPEAISKMSAQCLHSVALRRVMPG